MYGCIRRKRGNRSERRDISLPLPLGKALIYTQVSSLGTTSWIDTSCTGTNIPRDTTQ